MLPRNITAAYVEIILRHSGKKNTRAGSLQKTKRLAQIKKICNGF